MSLIPTSTFGAIAQGNNTAGQGSSSLNGAYASAPILAAMDQQTKTDISVLSEGKVGSFLRRRGLVSGQLGTVIDATLDFFMTNKQQGLAEIAPNIRQGSTTRRNFVPIIIKTDFNYDNSGTKKSPLYVVFDSTPDAISFSKSANWSQKDFLGRPEPVWTYNNSGATAFTLVGKFYAESFQIHKRNMKLSDFIMALVTPSKLNYMPSPVTVFIGEWKRLRCIVTNVTINYSGPWSITDTAERAADTSGTGLMPSHSPFMFEATFSFTVVGKDNEVKYAEQVIQDSNTGTPLTTDELKTLSTQYEATNIPSNITNGSMYKVTASTNYSFIGGVISRESKSELDYTEAAKNINLYDDANNMRRMADLGVISSALGSQMLLLYQKNNPKSLVNGSNALGSLNPFKKLF